MVAASINVEAHALLIASSPSPGSILAVPPTEILLDFTEPVTPFGRGIDVFSPTGRSMAIQAQATGRTLSARLAFPRIPEAGTYVVEWRVTAQDAHPSRGSFTFSIGHRTEPFTETSSPSGSGGISTLGLMLQAASRWLHVLGYAAVFGALIFEIVVLRVAPLAHLRRLVQLGILLLLLGTLLSVVAQAASLGGLDGPSIADVTASPFGRVAALQLGGALLMWAILPAIGASRQRGATWVPVLAIGLAAVDGLSGHAGVGAPFWLTWMVTSVHVAAMGTWVGGVVALLWLRGRGFSAGELALRFRPLAAVSVLAAVASGAVLAAIHLRTPTDLLLAPYGALLALKIIAVGAAMLAATYSRRSARPLVAEAGAMIAVLILASVLGSLPPFR